MTTYNKINCKCPSVLVMQCYRLIIFHTQRRFCAGLSVRVINSGHPVTYAGTFCINKPSHKIYCCIPALSTRHYTLLHNTNILLTKTFLRQPVTRERKYCQRQKCHSLRCYTHIRLTQHRPLQNMIQTQIRVKKFPFFLI